MLARRRSRGTGGTFHLSGAAHGGVPPIVADDVWGVHEPAPELDVIGGQHLAEVASQSMTGLNSTDGERQHLAQVLQGMRGSVCVDPMTRPAGSARMPSTMRRSQNIRSESQHISSKSQLFRSSTARAAAAPTPYSYSALPTTRFNGLIRTPSRRSLRSFTQ